METAAAKRESLRDLMEKAAEARLSCGLYIPREGLIEVGVGRGGQTHADTPKSAVLELERLLRERVGAGNTIVNDGGVQPDTCNAEITKGSVRWPKD